MIFNKFYYNGFSLIYKGLHNHSLDTAALSLNRCQVTKILYFGLWEEHQHDCEFCDILAVLWQRLFIWESYYKCLKKLKGFLNRKDYGNYLDIGSFLARAIGIL